jgi:plastocyanin
MNLHPRLSDGHRSNAALVLMMAAALALVLGLLLAACGSGSAGPANTTAPGGGTTAVTIPGGGTSVHVTMTNRSYDPATLTVRVGDTVTWVNQDAPQHDVVADNGEFKSQLFDKGQSFSFTFTKAGTYAYHCSIHPGMVGTVVVQ